MKKFLRGVALSISALFVALTLVSCSFPGKSNSNNNTVVPQTIDYRRRAISFLNAANTYLMDVNTSLNDSNSNTVYFSSTSKSEMDFQTQQVYDDFINEFDTSYFYTFKLLTSMSYLGEFALDKNLNVSDEVGDRTEELGLPNDAKTDKTVMYNFYYYFETDNILSCEVTITLKEPESGEKNRENTYYVYEKFSMQFDSYLSLENVCVLRKDYYKLDYKEMVGRREETRTKDVAIEYNILNMNKTNNSFSNVYLNVDDENFAEKDIAEISTQALVIKTVLQEYAKEVKLYTGTLYYTETVEQSNDNPVDPETQTNEPDTYASEKNIEYFYATQDNDGTLENGDYQKAVSSIKSNVFYKKTRVNEEVRIFFYYLKESYQNNFVKEEN